MTGYERAVCAGGYPPVLEQPDVRGYDGSWVEYGSLLGIPIEV
jgi:3-mercaptopyruvate sulfurtransferase SseA